MVKQIGNKSKILRNSQDKWRGLRENTRSMMQAHGYHINDRPKLQQISRQDFKNFDVHKRQIKMKTHKRNFLKKMKKAINRLHIKGKDSIKKPEGFATQFCQRKANEFDNEMHAQLFCDEKIAQIRITHAINRGKDLRENVPDQTKEQDYETDEECLKNDKERMIYLLNEAIDVYDEEKKNEDKEFFNAVFVNLHGFNLKYEE